MPVKQLMPMQVPKSSTNPHISPASTSGIKYSCGICETRGGRTGDVSDEVSRSGRGVPHPEGACVGAYTGRRGASRRSRRSASRAPILVAS
jgi:hypothetical protein